MIKCICSIHKQSVALYKRLDFYKTLPGILFGIGARCLMSTILINQAIPDISLSQYFQLFLTAAVTIVGAECVHTVLHRLYHEVTDASGFAQIIIVVIIIMVATTTMSIHLEHGADGESQQQVDIQSPHPAR